MAARRSGQLSPPSLARSSASHLSSLDPSTTHLRRPCRLRRQAMTLTVEVGPVILMYPLTSFEGESTSEDGDRAAAVAQSGITWGYQQIYASQKNAAINSI